MMIWAQLPLLRFQRWGLFVIGVALLGLPLTRGSVFTAYSVDTLMIRLAELLVLVTLASTWNLFSGLTGKIDLGHSVFFGVGIYTVAILMVKLGFPFGAAVLLGTLIGGVFGLIIGWRVLRLQGAYFSIAMLIIVLVTREIVRIARPITGGGTGLVLAFDFNLVTYYYLTAAAFVAIILIVRYVRFRSRNGVILAASEDEMLAANTQTAILSVFILSATLTALVGGLSLYRQRAVDPEQVFLTTQTIPWIAASMLGGLGTVSGPVIGGVMFYGLQTLLRQIGIDAELILEGLLIIFTLRYLPHGIVGQLSKSRRRETEGSQLGKYLSALFPK